MATPTRFQFLAAAHGISEALTILLGEDTLATLDADTVAGTCLLGPPRRPQVKEVYVVDADEFERYVEAQDAERLATVLEYAAGHLDSPDVERVCREHLAKPVSIPLELPIFIDLGTYRARR